MSAPKMPPMACTPKTSSESSALMSLFSPVTPHRHTTPTPRPIANAPGMPTLPAAGGIAARPAARTPREQRQGGGEIGVHEGEGGGAVRFERRAGVEAEPAKPQERGTDHGHGQAVRCHRLLAKSNALAEHKRGHQPGNARVDYARPCRRRSRARPIAR